MASRNDQGDRLPWQPSFDLHPPGDETIARAVAALDDVLAVAGFWRSGLGIASVDDDYEPLHIRATWVRGSLDDQQIGHADGASVWGSGLIRLSVDGNGVEITSRNLAPEVLAAMVRGYVAAADAPYQ